MPDRIALERMQAEERQVVPVVEEELVIERRVATRTPTIRLRKLVDSETVDVHQDLTDVDFDIERIAIGRALDEPASIEQHGDVTIVPIVEERLVVTKQLFLKEEVHITRRCRKRDAHSSIELRRESVVIEQFDPATEQWQAIEEPVDKARPE